MNQLFSIPVEPDDIGIYPFNLDEDELEVMYKQAMPHDFGVAVALMHRDEAGKANAVAFLDELNAEAHIVSIPKFELSGDVKTYFSIQALPWHLDESMSPAQRAWWFNGMYVQCGFWRTGLANDPWIMRGIATAMTWHDTRVKPFSSHRSLDPTPLAFESYHENDQIPAVLARNFRLVVNDIFREGVGVWCRDLVAARNEILIMVRTRLAGGDPQAEWERFEASGVNYYLDYPITTP